MRKPACLGAVFNVLKGVWRSPTRTGLAWWIKVLTPSHCGRNPWPVMGLDDDECRMIYFTCKDVKIVDGQKLLPTGIPCTGSSLPIHGMDWKRRPGRPLKRWEDDIAKVAVKTWSTLARDRCKWKNMEEAFTAAT
ncbi:jg20216 [Pararge aegeria aegeria]|uniref:Jg20216 protein n=1 Tax=Pararge aegeria aegeria TaxID=348720 RepID=A0A8S4R6Q5_9NEOP|nr:jg20216 [Pararge aegeria aegeria]